MVRGRAEANQIWADWAEANQIWAELGRGQSDCREHRNWAELTLSFFRYYGKIKNVIFDIECMTGKKNSMKHHENRMSYMNQNSHHGVH